MQVSEGKLFAAKPIERRTVNGLKASRLTRSLSESRGIQGLGTKMI